MFYNFGGYYDASVDNINNLQFKNVKDINNMFNNSSLGISNFTIYDKIENYSDFSTEYLTLDYVNDKSKKIAENIVASDTNNHLELGTLVTK